MTLKPLQLSSLFLLLLACQGGQSDEEGTCDPGSLNCECVQGQLCLEGLECNAGLCTVVGETGSGDGDGDSGDGDGDTSSGDGDGTPGDGDPGDGDGTPGDGDGAPGDGDGDPGCGPGLMECNGACVDLMADNDNCGACGVACKVVDDLGQCVDGQCGDVWSDCHDANAELIPCSEVCQNEGLTCSAGGCGGGTLLLYEQLDSCEGVAGSIGGGNLPCDYPQVQNSDYYRCCCAQ